MRELGVWREGERGMEIAIGSERERLNLLYLNNFPQFFKII